MKNKNPYCFDPSKEGFTFPFSASDTYSAKTKVSQETLIKINKILSKPWKESQTSRVILSSDLDQEVEEIFSEISEIYSAVDWKVLTNSQVDDKVDYLRFIRGEH